MHEPLWPCPLRGRRPRRAVAGTVAAAVPPSIEGTARWWWRLENRVGAALEVVAKPGLRRSAEPRWRPAITP